MYFELLLLISINFTVWFGHQRLNWCVKKAQKQVLSGEEKKADEVHWRLEWECRKIPRWVMSRLMSYYLWNVRVFGVGGLRKRDCSLQRGHSGLCRFFLIVIVGFCLSGLRTNVLRVVQISTITPVFSIYEFTIFFSTQLFAIILNYLKNIYYSRLSSIISVLHRRIQGEGRVGICPCSKLWRDSIQLIQLTNFD